VVIVIEELVLQLEQGPVCEAFINCSWIVAPLSIEFNLSKMFFVVREESVGVTSIATLT
jgi:hypothetical protein